MLRSLLALWIGSACGLAPAGAESPPFGEEPSCVLLTCEASDCWRVRPELLVWWLRSGRLPVLLTTGPADSQGILGQPGVRVIYGDEKIDTNRHLGGRLTADCALDECLSLRVAFFVVERNSRQFQVDSDGDFLVARPFTDADTGQPASEILAGPTASGVRSGGFDGLSKIELFGEQAALHWSPTDAAAPVHLFAGFYLLQMRERLDFTGVSHLSADASLFGETDRFRIHNRFYGLQVGLEGEWTCGPCFLQFRSLAAIGSTQRVLKARGERIVQTPLQRDVFPNGFLVLPSNEGTHRDDALSFVCEVGVNLGYSPSDGCRLFLGYTLIRWSDLLRAGDQIDTTLDLSQRGGVSGDRPTVSFREDYFWAMGVNGGVEVRW